MGQFVLKRVRINETHLIRARISESVQTPTNIHKCSNNMQTSLNTYECNKRKFCTIKPLTTTLNPNVGHDCGSSACEITFTRVGRHETFHTDCECKYYRTYGL